MKLLQLILLLLFMPFACIAGESSIVYSKATIRIVPQPGTVKPEPQPATPASDNAAAKKTDAYVKSHPIPPAPAPARETKEISVEVRPLSILQQKDFIVHEPFSDKEGLLILVDPPQSLALKAAPLLGKSDVLLVTADGTIAKIAPNLILTELDEPIDAGAPVRAFVFLKAGLAEESDIQPGDHVQSTLFKTHPIVLDSPNRPIIIENAPTPDATQPQTENNTAPAPTKRHKSAPADTSNVVYPLSSAPPAENQQLMQELQK